MGLGYQQPDRQQGLRQEPAARNQGPGRNDGRGNQFLNGQLGQAGQGGQEIGAATQDEGAQATADSGTLSGASWVAQFPTSTSLDDLQGAFKSNCTDFVNALQEAGASVSIEATFRPPERAYLMHYAYKIANGEIAAKNVPPMAGVDINWVHPTNRASVAAAQAMVNGYGIVYGPALTSRHSEGAAIDMSISWSGALKIKKKDGTEVSIGAPRGGGNTSLHAVGASYGVIKLVSDPPHWSSDGH